ncbi:hypothetical protein BGP_5036 [Beggiatoa sp. PS]|nr:hypothetical protein BGP_5036 [Beggiatoa sp. PS]
MGLIQIKKLHKGWSIPIQRPQCRENRTTQIALNGGQPKDVAHPTYA